MWEVHCILGMQCTAGGHCPKKKSFYSLSNLFFLWNTFNSIRSVLPPQPHDLRPEGATKPPTPHPRGGAAMLLVLLLGFLFGAAAVVATEAVALLFALSWLRRRALGPSNEPRGGGDLEGDQPLSSLCSKQGTIWILEPEKFENDLAISPREQKDLVEVFPVKKFAVLKDHCLILTDTDGSQATIRLLNCTILAASASNLSSRKWAKRYPLKLENKDSELYNGSKICYLYLETSWEKESWCKALRLASCLDNDKLEWYSQLKEDFNQYLVSLNIGCPLLIKPSTMVGDTTEKTNRIDETSSKVRLFIKKIAKKSSKVVDRATSSPPLSYSERTDGLTNSAPTSALGSACQAVPASSLSSASNKLCETTGKEKQFGDEGTLCWNLLFSRLFFDAKRSSAINDIIKGRIQRTLSNMRIPSYVGGVTCTTLNLGSLPPFIHSAKVLPVDLNEIWAIEIDMEYSGGIVLDIETRLDVREPELQKSIIEARPELNPSEEAAHDFLDGIEYYSNKLNQSGASLGAADNISSKDWPDDGLKQSKSTNWTSTYLARWKAIKNSIADQVSQVPLVLAIKITSLRGTLRLHIKPPPSDQLWFAFTSMPDIDWNLESSIGERKITNGHIASLIGNRFKASIRDSMVLPNCGSLCIPWMLAEKEDWIPRKVAPFLWTTKHEAAEAVDPDAASHPRADNADLKEIKIKPDGRGSSKSRAATVHGSSHHGCEDEMVKDVVHVQQPPEESVPGNPSSDTRSPAARGVLEELREPLLSGNGEARDAPQAGALSSLVADQRTMPSEGDDDGKQQKKVGRRARMMDLGKKMSEKLDEKRRELEEKGKHIVEKIRENSRS